MALQAEANTANPLKFSEIQEEFASSNTSFYAYRKGAGIVDADDFAPNVVSTGTLQFTHFLGAARVDLAVNLPQYNAGLGADVVLSASAYDNNPSATVWASAQLILYANGAGIYRESNYNTGDVDQNFTWLTSGSASSVYAYLDTPVGGSVTGTSSAVATSLQMTTTRAWTFYVQTVGYGDIQLNANTALRLKNSSNTDLDSVTVGVFLSAVNGSL